MTTEIYSASAAKEKQPSIDHPESWWPWLASLINKDQSETPKLSEEIPVPQQVETNGETLLEIVNFILREVVVLKKKKDQIKLLTHYLAAIAREAHQATSHLVYSIEFDEQKGIQLIDHIYQDNGNIKKVCQSAIEQAQTDVERTRYELELNQVERLLSALNGLAKQGASFIFAKTLEEAASEKIRQLFSQIGWKKTSNLITPEVAQQLQLKSPFVDCWAGQKNVYIMPQSDVHPGGYSVVVLTQPIFIPDQNQWVLLHSQYMIKMSWQDHLEFSQKTTNQSLDPKTEAGHDLEQTIMSQLIELTPRWQTLSAEETFLALLGQFETREKRDQLETRTKLNQLNIENYAQYILEILAIENCQQTLSASQISQIKIALKRVVLSGLFDLNPMNNQELTKLIRHYVQFKNKDAKRKNTKKVGLEKLFVSSLLSLGYQSAGKSFDLSLVECLTMSPFSALSPKSSNLPPGSNPVKGLSWLKEQNHCLRCPRCGQISHNPLICSHCGYKRGAPLNLRPNQDKDQDNHQSTSNQSRSHREFQQTQTASIGLSQFVSGYDSKLAATDSF
jgi:ribosomal protein L37E